jgi:hypothetical protein
LETGCGDIKEAEGDIAQESGQQPQKEDRTEAFGRARWGLIKHWASRGADTVGQGVVTVGAATRGGVDKAGGFVRWVTSSDKPSEEAKALEKETERQTRVRVSPFICCFPLTPSEFELLLRQITAPPCRILANCILW